MAIDEITLQVLHNRFEAIAEEMQSVMLRSSYSGIINEVGDASSALFSVAGEAIAHSVAIPLHLGVMGAAVRSILEHFPLAGMQDGDSYILNDPYLGGTHLPDLVVATPVLAEDGPVALAAVLAHHSDVGGLVHGSMAAHATEIFQEGLQIPPCKLRECGTENVTLFAIIERNVREPREVVADIRGQIGATVTGTRLLLDVLGEYGSSAVLEYMEALLDRAEAMTRASLRALPDGTATFEDYIDHDGVDLTDRLLQVKATVTIAGDQLMVDLTGTHAQTRGSANGPPSTAVAPAVYALRTLIDSAVPVNGGTERPITIELPEGSMVNPRRPAPVALRGQLASRVLKAINGALVQIVPGRLTADSGEHDGVLGFSSSRGPGGVPWHLAFEPIGGMGARPTKDGVDAVSMGLSNAINVPAEIWEGEESPVRLARQALRTDSGGAGTWRGGLGIVWRFEILHGTVEASWRGDRTFSRPWGLFGGKAGASWQLLVLRADGSSDEIPGRGVFHLYEGDLLEVRGGGSGGYGDPLERSTERVHNDLRDGKISVEAARHEYGVIITADGLAIDGERTGDLRKRLRLERGPITWTIDRGNGERV